MSDPFVDDDVLAQRVATAYRGLTPLDDDARRRLDHALDSSAAGRAPASRSWALPMRPLASLAWALALLAVGVLVGRFGFRPPLSPERAATRLTSDAPQEVAFVLVAPAASQVAVVGDFNGWDPTATPMTRHAGGAAWTVRIHLAPGRHVYAFVMDGAQWVSDPLAPLAPANEYGMRNSVVVVNGGPT
jgi:hypothetical protein